MTFKTGDRVRIKNDGAKGAKVKKGDIGVVTNFRGCDSGYGQMYTVNVNNINWLLTEEDVEPLPVAVGDEVTFKGVVTEVVASPFNCSTDVRVDFDSDDFNSDDNVLWFDLEELEKILVPPAGQEHVLEVEGYSELAQIFKAARENNCTVTINVSPR